MPRPPRTGGLPSGRALPLETAELRRELAHFLETSVDDPVTGRKQKIGNYKFGVYAFYDYDGEPIYVGQTNERLRTRIRRHLTNQRTDAVAMNVLDSFEVRFIEVWPLPEHQSRNSDDQEARTYLNSLEYSVFQHALEQSRFTAILNEKEPNSTQRVQLPASHRGTIVSGRVLEIRGHPDIRIARRAATLARLAQVVSERQVQSGLRKTLLTQARRMQWLAERRYSEVLTTGAADNEQEEDDRE